MKFNDIYLRRGTATMPFFFVELDRENQKKLTKWINENHVAFKELEL
jgi:hypothetical protein